MPISDNVILFLTEEKTNILWKDHHKEAGTKTGSTKYESRNTSPCSSLFKLRTLALCGIGKDNPEN